MSSQSLIIIPPVIFIFVVLYYWWYAHCKQNSIFFKDRYFELDGDFLSGYLDDGTTYKINIKNIIKMQKTSKYLLLYVAKDQFIYMPSECFQSEADLCDFEEQITKNLGDL